MNSNANQNQITELKNRTNEADEHKMKVKEKPNTPKKANTGSKPPLSSRYTTLLEEESEDQRLKAPCKNAKTTSSLHNQCFFFFH
jgi:hypothetical protein